MHPSPLRKFIWRFTHRRFKSSEDYFLKRTRFGELNEFLKFPVVSTDSHEYTLPFMTNPFRSKTEKDCWNKDEVMDVLAYEYTDDHQKKTEADANFDIAYGMVKDRIAKVSTIFDIGCNTGYFLEKWHQKGFSNLHGLDPQKTSIDYARENRPYLNVKQGFFGSPENDVECDLLVFFQSITRIPYQDRLFEAISRCARKYVLISWVEDSCTLFNRDFHVGLAKQGLMCIEKKVVNGEFAPYGTAGSKDADGPMIVTSEKGERLPNFTSHFLFRRIEPRD